MISCGGGSDDSGGGGGGGNNAEEISCPKDFCFNVAEYDASSDEYDALKDFADDASADGPHLSLDPSETLPKTNPADSTSVISL